MLSLFLNCLCLLLLLRVAVLFAFCVFCIARRLICVLISFVSPLFFLLVCVLGLLLDCVAIVLLLVFVVVVS